MNKLTLQGHITVPAKDLSAVMAELPAHIARTRAEEGCLLFEVTQSPDDPCVFNVYEEFVDRTAFELHRQRVRASAWGTVTEDVERHYSISE
ncbi:antibiotic biosynthesis monooxygenase [Aestuariicella sp. G3-2]|uniref:putative quinol monooxygenase n=1 Tax=Pseudomaricurvus albidus TaxID=2842452 RepID=UPI001C0BF148|nr:putative quinol monooxygenase [Aestuariicella albida]MBU3070771.1 antibiotic biosynthesis monooxygenase [Aestuariicella albida]